jgi:hypothetical protein
VAFLCMLRFNLHSRFAASIAIAVLTMLPAIAGPDSGENFQFSSVSAISAQQNAAYDVSKVGLSFHSAIPSGANRSTMPAVSPAFKSCSYR